MAWLIPLMAGLALYRWQQKERRWAVTLAFVLLFISLFLGQSRAALLGVFISLFIVIWLILPRGALALCGLDRARPGCLCCKSR